MSFWKQTLATALGVVLGGLALGTCYLVPEGTNGFTQNSATLSRPFIDKPPEPPERSYEELVAEAEARCLDPFPRVSFTDTAWEELLKDCRVRAEVIAKMRLGLPLPTPAELRTSE